VNDYDVGSDPRGRFHSSSGGRSSNAALPAETDASIIACSGIRRRARNDHRSLPITCYSGNLSVPPLAPILAVVAIWKSRIASSRVRLPWILFGVALLLWTTGILLSAWEELFQHVSPTVTFFSDFVFFLYGVPILLAISSPGGGRRISLFVSLDGIQAVLTAYLTYVTLFTVGPFTRATIHPISEMLLVRVYNVENIVLACAALLRVLARPSQEEERHFFRTLCGFLCLYAICAGVYNYVSSIADEHTMVDVLVVVPFLFLVVSVLRPLTQKEEGTDFTTKKQITLLIENASPVFYTLALLALGITVVRAHFYTGITAIIVALAVYAIRTTILQTRYMQSQEALHEALDRLEEISLKDGLTNVANRRCFDETLEREWNRATRTQHTLSLLLLDIDHFKNLNDRYGHPHGDQCLVEIAAALQSVLIRSGDLLARYGGEEFAVILPSTDMNGAKLVANRLQEAVRSLNIQNETSIGHFTTISIGIAVYQFPQAGSPAILIKASDRALYMAKRNGRNQIGLSSMQAVFDTSSVL
jgi:diguanylate cyclase (GGDEF)-like protein